MTPLKPSVFSVPSVVGTFLSARVTCAVPLALKSFVYHNFLALTSQAKVCLTFGTENESVCRIYGTEMNAEGMV